MRLESYGIAVEVPPGWDARIYRRDDPGAEPNLHLANFPLPAEDGDFGSGALSTMGPGGIFIAVDEYIADVAGQGIFEPQGLPLPIEPSELEPSSLQRRRPGQVGVQRFFTAVERPFCLYLVVGTPPHPRRLVERANEALATIRIDPRS